MLIIGIDDAGRGPILGPMILAGVLVTTEQDKVLKEKGAVDSKIISHKVRMSVSKDILSNSIDNHVEVTYPNEIDSSINGGVNLNTLEAMKAASIINKLNNKKDKIKVVVDCPSVNTKAWKSKLIEFIDNSDNLDIYCEHKADANYPSVSAASILAKVRREEEMDKIKKDYSKYGDVGSGYPSDPYTKEFLKQHGKELSNSGIFRKSWATWKNLFADKNQSTLD